MDPVGVQLGGRRSRCVAWPEARMAAAGLGFSSPSVPLSLQASARQIVFVARELAGGVSGGRRPDPVVQGPDPAGRCCLRLRPPWSGAFGLGCCLTMVGHGDRCS